MREQLDRVAHSTMLGLSHPSAIELARRLVEIAPRGPHPRLLLGQRLHGHRDRAEDGVPVLAAGAARSAAPRFVCLRDAYHGDTIGSVSAGGIDLFHSMYRPLLFDTLKAEPGDLEAMERLLDEHDGEVAAVMMEPLVQGAAGMLVHPEGYLRGVRELCDRHGVLLILDEVATGFGRTGRMFACEHEGVAPDLLCVAKGITGGYLPLAATLATERIYEGFLGEFEDFRTFFHGHTYTGNPLACAAALATLDVFEEEHTIERLQPKIDLLGRLLEASGRPSGRRRGAPARPHDRDRARATFPLELRMGHRVTLEARRRGAIVRPLGDVVVLMPPLSIAEADLTRLVEITGEAIAAATDASAGGAGSAAGGDRAKREPPSTVATWPSCPRRPSRAGPAAARCRVRRTALT